MVCHEMIRFSTQAQGNSAKSMRSAVAWCQLRRSTLTAFCLSQVRLGVLEPVANRMTNMLHGLRRLQ